MSKNNDKEKGPKKVPAYYEEGEAPPKPPKVYRFEDCQSFLKFVRRSFYWMDLDEQEGILYHMENLIGAFKEQLAIGKYKDYMKRSQK